MDILVEEELLGRRPRELPSAARSVPKLGIGSRVVLLFERKRHPCSQTWFGFHYKEVSQYLQHHHQQYLTLHTFLYQQRDPDDYSSCTAVQQSTFLINYCTDLEASSMRGWLLTTSTRAEQKLTNPNRATGWLDGCTPTKSSYFSFGPACKGGLRRTHR